MVKNVGSADIIVPNAYFGEVVVEIANVLPADT